MFPIVLVSVTEASQMNLQCLITSEVELCSVPNDLFILQADK